MYKLTIEFPSKQDLINFLAEDSNSGHLTQTVKVEAPAAKEFPAGPVEEKTPAQKGAETKARKAAEAKAAEEAARAASPSNTAPSVPDEQHGYAQPTVQPSKPVVDSGAVAFDRAAALAKATTLVGVLKSTGLADAQIMPTIHEVYAHAGCPTNLKVSQFDDAQLQRFLPLFEQKVNLLSNQPKQQPTGSFI